MKINWGDISKQQFSNIFDSKLLSFLKIIEDLKKLIYISSICLYLLLKIKTEKYFLKHLFANLFT